MKSNRNKFEAIKPFIKMLESQGADVSYFDEWALKLNKLRGLAVTLQKYFEYQCNGCTREKLSFESWQAYDVQRELQMEWVEKRIKQITKQIDKLSKELGLHYYIQTDPRGASLYVCNEPIDDNTYNTQAVALY
jgi:hypothetical protein